MDEEDDANEDDLDEELELWWQRIIEELERADLDEVAAALASTSTRSEDDQCIMIDGVYWTWQVAIATLEIKPDLPPEIQTILRQLKKRRHH